MLQILQQELPNNAIIEEYHQRTLAVTPTHNIATRQGDGSLPSPIAVTE